MRWRHSLSALIAPVLVIPLALVAVDGLNDELREYLPVGPRLSPTQYKAGENASQDVRLVNDEYRFNYVFRDHLSREWRWKWGWSESDTSAAIEGYGIPKWVVEPYKPVPEVLAQREAAMSAGLFEQTGRKISPDYSAMVSAYANYTGTLHDLARTSMGEHTRTDRARMLLAFMQDIPYGIPPLNDGDRFIGELIPPPQVLVEKWGDCDSKVVLFASILAHDPAYDVVLLPTTNHLLTGIAGVPRPYQTFVTWRGKRYILADPAGPGRLALGDTGGRTYSSFENVHHVDANLWTGTPYRAGTSASVGAERSFTSGDLHLLSWSREEDHIKLRLRAGSPLEVVASLELEDQQRPDAVPFAQKRADGDYEVLVRPPGPGDYTVRVYSKARGSDGDLLQAVEFPMQWADTPDSPVSFPTAFRAFNRAGGQLRTPLQGRLAGGTTAWFDLDLPGAEEVAVIVGDQWHMLRKEGIRFRGKAEVNHSDFGVYGRFAGETNFAGLLQYQPYQP